MKKITLLVLVIICKVAVVKSAEVFNNDTINFTDALGKKQGHWIVFNATLHKPGYTDDQKVEEGKFVDSKKTGIWETFFPNNKIKNKIPYDNNRQDGYAISYYENGNVREEGVWKNNRWVGDYKLYYETGKIQQEFKYNTTGKREGPQKYYNENGQKIIEGNWAEGKEAGILKEFYDNGDLKAEKKFDNGTLDVASIKTYETKNAITKIAKKIEEPAPPVIVKEEKDNLGKSFNGEGYWKLFNANKQVSKDGVFSKNKLVDGKVYYYSKDGILTRIAVYKEGRYEGDSVVEQ